MGRSKLRFRAKSAWKQPKQRHLDNEAAQQQEIVWKGDGRECGCRMTENCVGGTESDGVCFVGQCVPSHSPHCDGYVAFGEELAGALVAMHNLVESAAAMLQKLRLDALDFLVF